MTGIMTKNKLIRKIIKGNRSYHYSLIQKVKAYNEETHRDFYLGCNNLCDRCGLNNMGIESFASKQHEILDEISRGLEFSECKENVIMSGLVLGVDHNDTLDNIIVNSLRRIEECFDIAHYDECDLEI